MISDFNNAFSNFVSVLKEDSEVFDEFIDLSKNNKLNELHTDTAYAKLKEDLNYLKIDKEKFWNYFQKNNSLFKLILKRNPKELLFI